MIVGIPSEGKTDVVTVAAASAFSMVPIAGAESEGAATATLGCVVAAVMLAILVTVGVGSSGLVDVDKAAGWEADAVSLLMLAPPKLAMLLPKFCESTRK